jgi:hypothetical protein
VHQRAADGLDSAEKDLNADLEELTIDAAGHFTDLKSIEEPLQKSFADEILIVQNADGDDEQVLLKDNMARFQKLVAEKQAILQSLWEDWEETQLELVKLSVELLGVETIRIEHDKDSISPGHQDKLETVVQTAQTTHEQAIELKARFHTDLKEFTQSLCQLTKSKKEAVDCMEQVCGLPFAQVPPPDANIVAQDLITFKKKRLADMYNQFKGMEDD